MFSSHLEDQRVSPPGVMKSSAVEEGEIKQIFSAPCGNLTAALIFTAMLMTQLHFAMSLQRLINCILDVKSIWESFFFFS